MCPVQLCRAWMLQQNRSESPHDTGKSRESQRWRDSHTYAHIFDASKHWSLFSIGTVTLNCVSARWTCQSHRSEYTCSCPSESPLQERRVMIFVFSWIDSDAFSWKVLQDHRVIKATFVALLASPVSSRLTNIVRLSSVKQEFDEASLHLQQKHRVENAWYRIPLKRKGSTIWRSELFPRLPLANGDAGNRKYIRWCTTPWSVRIRISPRLFRSLSEEIFDF